MIHKIIHLTSAHPRYDTRIFLKECSSLAKNKMYRVNLVVADGLENEVKNNVNIFDVGKKESRRFLRMIKTVSKVYKKAIELDGDIYHLHDPELIPIGLKLKRQGKKVIFDVHENIALQIKEDKDYIPKIFRNIISKGYKKFEQYALKKFDYLVLAENSYHDFYKGNKTETVLNMPDLNMLDDFLNLNRNKKNDLYYLGAISFNRGLDINIEALKLLKKDFPNIYFHYIGNVSKKLLNELDLYELENNIKFYGSKPLNEALTLSYDSKVGISILKPIENYKRSYSTKIFEYMAIGLPVVTSNFPLYKNIVEKYNCGLCVDPNNSFELAIAISYILKNPDEAKEMSKNGRKLIEEKFNWAIEEKKLHGLYEKLFK